MKMSKNRVCNVCRSPARIYHKDKWWCGLDYNTANGMCKKLKGKDETTDIRRRDDNGE